MHEYALIVAGGSGSRMRSEVPKQFLLLQGKPVLMHTLETFHTYSPSVEIILVLPENQLDTWSKLCQEYNFTIPHHIQRGGNTRFQSVKNGLALVINEGLVAIHDGVRPLLGQELLKKCFQEAALFGNSVAAVPAKDSLRWVEGYDNKSVERKYYWQIQTPQTFRCSVIKEAYKTEERETFTDDASVAEAAGAHIHLTTGDYRNIKITTPEDLVIADALLSKPETKTAT
ncbi:2-C-methyl-D-erythritol 4-phosphate cytidylyltransferase [Cytophagales bacterium LB-30]|uniref:2-C-methyl-D-erythritol 4-phosphate cytidylyltransferase n=2 Tax=Shiella aurantiaca TaxID=3058365 RepID=A0ABT8F4D5_9BACT|nr:2-C-methyl-D-erythritol 4-phosphate cytidylyltransferase [Shiella aurantiaca]